MNKKISTPIAIGIILILSVILGSFTLLQYLEIHKEDNPTSEIKIEPYIKIISPNGGEKLIVGKTYDVSWKSSGMEKVYIGYEEDSETGDAVHTGWIVKDIVANNKKYSWEIPDSFFPSNYKIRIQSFDPVGIGVPEEMEFSDESDNYFSIVSGGTGLKDIENQLASISVAISQLIEWMKALTGSR